MVSSSRGYEMNDEGVTLNPVVSCVSSEGKPGTEEIMRQTRGGRHVFREREADKRRRACLFIFMWNLLLQSQQWPRPSASS